MLRTLGAIYIRDKEIHVSRGVIEDIENAVGLIVYDENEIRIVSLSKDDYENDLLCQIEYLGDL